MTMTADDPSLGQHILSLAADFKATLGRIDKGINKLSARAEYGTVFATVQGTTVIQAATGEGVLAFDNDGGPAMGQVWNVRRLCVGGVGSVLQTVNGRADVFVSGVNPAAFVADPLVGMSILGWSDTATSLPNIAFYGTGELRLTYPEKLYVVFSGAAVGNTRAAVALIEVVQDAARAQVQTT